MPYKAVLFDLDGTLLDTLEDLSNSVNRVLKQKGFPTHPLEAYRNYIGDGAVMLITRSLPEEQRNEHIIQTCLNMFLEEYSRNWNVKTKPYDNVPEMLDALTSLKMKMAVLSNKPNEFTKQCVTEMLADWSFNLVLGSRDGIPRKPNPEGALEVARNLKTAPADFLYLGDTDIDMKTSTAAGMFPVGVLWGFRSKEELKESGAKVLIENPMEVLTLLR